MATEKRMIDANVTIDSFTKWLTSTYDGRMPGDIVAEIPTVDAVEVVHGRWERMDTRYVEQFKCSVCRGECYVPTCMGEPMYDYCPNCGAKMDGDVSG